MTTQEKICQYLETLPSEWRNSIKDALLAIVAEKEEVECSEFKECEVVTSLSNFSVDGTVVSINYRDENNVVVTRSFDARDILNNILNNVDPNCLASVEDWLNMTIEEKFETLITSHCNCCE